MKNTEDPSGAPGAEEVVDIEEYTKSGKKPPQGKNYRVRIGDEFVIFDHQIVIGKEILEKGGFSPTECYSLYLKQHGCDFEKISREEKVDLGKPGIERFVIKPPEVFYYHLDDEPETTDENFLTANSILEAGGLNNADYYLVQIFASGEQKSYKDSPTEPIKMVCPGHKFVSIFRGEVPVS